MTAAPHLIIAHAAPPPDRTPTTPPLLPRLLQHAVVEASHAGDGWSLTPPHEHALATALGWPITDGALPWAAWHAQRIGVACAWLHPCHWQPSLDHVRIVPPAALDIRSEEATALASALARLAADDGLTLHIETAQRWRLEGAALAHWRGASLDRVAHQRADPWWQRQGAASADHPAVRALLRLLTEAQMLFADHAANDARARRGQPALNGVWLDGAGVWDGCGPSPAQADAAVVDLWDGTGPLDDAADWAAAWARLQTAVLQPWARSAIAAPGTPRPLRLTLCGTRGWRRWRLHARTVAEVAGTVPASRAASDRGSAADAPDAPAADTAAPMHSAATGPRRSRWLRWWPWGRADATDDPTDPLPWWSEL
ncbi:hypothetical protein [Tepidimonas charontis]|uniref:Cofactor-independent phosphoglycerate mutase n=1 Tax=Tepidimonas charontis TaxID=2267262 RepID=A0A554X9V7_9BURK|nr:hypothetical protein [Tepidimonas charontis]TSE32601.1 hypothetical protein Tchar_02045 [Tepidimonas charontis]